MTYFYTAMNEDGKEVAGMIEGENENEAAMKLRLQGLFPTTVQKGNVDLNQSDGDLFAKKGVACTIASGGIKEKGYLNLRNRDSLTEEIVFIGKQNRQEKILPFAEAELDFKEGFLHSELQISTRDKTWKAMGNLGLFTAVIRAAKTERQEKEAKRDMSRIEKLVTEIDEASTRAAMEFLNNVAKHNDFGEQELEKMHKDGGDLSKQLDLLIREADREEVLSALENLKPELHFHLHTSMASDYGQWGEFLAAEFKRLLQASLANPEKANEHELGGFYKACEVDSAFWRMVCDALREIIRTGKEKVALLCLEYLFELAPQDGDPDLRRIVESQCDSKHWRIRYRARTIFNAIAGEKERRKAIGFLDKIRARFAYWG